MSEKQKEVINKIRETAAACPAFYTDSEARARTEGFLCALNMVCLLFDEKKVN